MIGMNDLPSGCRTAACFTRATSIKAYPSPGSPCPSIWLASASTRIGRSVVRGHVYDGGG